MGYFVRASTHSSNSARVFSVCLATMQTIEARAVREKWGRNECLGFNSIDSASVATGIQWDNTRRMMVGQCQSHHFQPMTNKFHQMADERKGDMESKEAEPVSVLCLFLHVQVK